MTLVVKMLRLRPADSVPYVLSVWCTVQCRVLYERCVMSVRCTVSAVYLYERYVLSVWCTVSSVYCMSSVYCLCGARSCRVLYERLSERCSV